MEEALREHGVAVEFAEADDGTVSVGYRTHRTDATELFTELRFVVKTVLEHEPEAEVRGAVFLTDHPVLAVWTVESEWATAHRDGDLSSTALAARVLQGLRTHRFR